MKSCFPGILVCVCVCVRVCVRVRVSKCACVFVISCMFSAWCDGLEN